MKCNAVILLLLLLCFAGCAKGPGVQSMAWQEKPQTTIVDKSESDRDSIYKAIVNQRNAVQQAVVHVAPMSSVRSLTQKDRQNVNGFSRYATLVAVHTFNADELLHNHMIRFVAFSMEDHIFRLRRIRI